MLATLVAAPFDDPDWQFEIKWDGFRVEAVIVGSDVRLWTRGQQDAARYFGNFLEPPAWINAHDAIVDGEVIALDDRGEPDFALLQERIKGRGTGGAVNPFVYEVFDLLHLDGRSLLDEARHPRRIRGLDRRRSRPPGCLQGLRPRQGPAEGPSRGRPRLVAAKTDQWTSAGAAS
jgi:bifunctional non-homologous end joining protein LigD